MLRYLMLRRVADPATCEVFRSHWTTMDASEAEAAMTSGGWGQGFDRTECIGVEVIRDAPPTDGKEGES